jgi:hypothetical protein
LGRFKGGRWSKPYGIYTGPRPASWSDFKGIDDLDLMNLDDVLGCMERSELLVFEYSGFDRLVAPFVLGVSSEGAPLLRAYQVEGTSKGGAGYGWRVFKVREMSMVARGWEFFNVEDFDFNDKYPWTYKVFKMLSSEAS